MHARQPGRVGGVPGGRDIRTRAGLLTSTRQCALCNALVVNIYAVAVVVVVVVVVVVAVVVVVVVAAAVAAATAAVVVAPRVG